MAGKRGSWTGRLLGGLLAPLGVLALLSGPVAAKDGLKHVSIAVGGAANLFTIAASCVAEAVATHPSRKLVLFDGKIVARDGAFLAAPIGIASGTVA